MGGKCFISCHFLQGASIAMRDPNSCQTHPMESKGESGILWIGAPLKQLEKPCNLSLAFQIKTRADPDEARTSVQGKGGGDPTRVSTSASHHHRHFVPLSGNAWETRPVFCISVHSQELPKIHTTTKMTIPVVLFAVSPVLILRVPF